MNKFKRDLPGDRVQAVFGFDDYPEFHNWEKEIKRLGLAGRIRIGEVTMLNILHDEWCGSYNRDRCNCEPEIQNRLSGEILNRRSH